MIDKRAFDKIERVIKSDQLSALQDVCVFVDSAGTYQIFNRYSIKKVDDTYQVSGASIINKMTFYSLKNAVTWCTFDHRVKMGDCKRISELDRRLAGIDTDIAQHQKLAKTAKNTDDKLIFLAKLGEEKLIRREMLSQLSKYISESRNWQLRRFSKKPTQ